MPDPPPPPSRLERIAKPLAIAAVVLVAFLFVYSLLDAYVL
jgi:uncharacterized membrane protein YjfL (UPF0719 family)